MALQTPGWRRSLPAYWPGGAAGAWCSAGNDGLDELTTTGPSTVWEIRDGAVTELVFSPQDLGISLATVEQLRGGDAQVNAAVVRDVLAGKAGPARDAVLLNAAAGLVAFDLTADGPFLDRMRRRLRTAPPNPSIPVPRRRSWRNGCR